jgi:hypothetical protein
MALTPSELRRRKMNLLMAMSYAAFASTKASTWSPTLLFAAGEQGAWYDPSDFSTMFQDSAGTTPVTAVEQPVGMILDKRKGLALGSELVGSTWSVSDATWSQSGSTLIAVNGSSFSCYQSIITAGTWYKVSFEIFDYASGSVSVRLGNAGAPTGFSASANGTYTAIGLGAGDTAFYWMGSGTFNGKIRNISVKALAGNHASQSTSASRPVLSARVNLLTRTEDFRNTAAAGETRPWLWQHLTAAATTETAPPSGLTTATKIVSTSSTQVNGYVAVLVSVPAGSKSFVYAKKGNTNFVSLYTFSGTAYTAWAVFNLNTGVVSSSASCTPDIENAGDGWYRCWFVNTSSATQYFYVIAKDADPAAQPYANGTWALGNYIYIAGADLRVTNDGVGIPAYQRVGAAVTATTNPAVTGVPDYDTSGFPYYIRADGTDDRLATSAIDFSGTDAVTVWAGVRKLSDAARGTVLELTASADANNGSFHLTAPNAASATYAFESKGTALTDAVVSSAVAAPITSVLTAQADISADQNILRVNGVQADSDTGDQGTGNYSNAILYIGSRGGSTLPYNGRIYGVILRGAASSAAEIASAERWMASKTGITL